jgi:hypothetical protein
MSYFSNVFLLLALAFGSTITVPPTVRFTPADVNTFFKQPQLAASGQTVAVAYGAGNELFVRVSRDGANTFERPVKIGAAKFLALGNHRGPRIAITPKALVVSAVVGTARGQDGDVVAWRSLDGGKTWSPGVRVNSVAASAREGLHGMASGPNGQLFLNWLDLRTKGMKLYGATSNDGGATWSTNFLIYESPDGHICECCHPTALIGKNGELYAMWRNWLNGARDMHVAESADGGKSFKISKLGQGTWPLNACPMDGGGLATDATGHVHSAWRRSDTVYYAQAGKPEVEIGKGKNPAFAMSNDIHWIAWNDGHAIKLATTGKPARVLASHGAFPVLAGNGPVYAAWEENNSIVVQRVD